MGGAAPLGLLDYQDAVAAHPAYDLVSALQDARRDVDPATEQAQIARYLAATGLAEAPFRAAYALIGAQRALRILGVFARLAIRDGKPRYLDMMPRVWAAITRDLSHPALAPLAAALADVPPPTPEIIAAIRARSAGADGAKQAIQANTEMAAAQVNELHRLREIMMEDARMNANALQIQAERQAADDADMTRFMSTPAPAFTGSRQF